MTQRKTQLAAFNPVGELGASPADSGGEQLPAEAPPEAAPPPSAEPALPRFEDAPAPLSPQALEERVRRLEDVLAGLQNTRTGIQETPTPASPALDAAAGDPPAAPPEATPFAGAGGTPWLSPALFPSQRWLPFEMLAEFRSMIRMYLDPRYRLTWQTRLLPPLILLGMFLSRWLIGGTPIVGTILDWLVTLLLAYLLFKVLTREATRYRMTSPDLPPSLRL